MTSKKTQALLHITISCQMVDKCRDPGHLGLFNMLHLKETLQNGRKPGSFSSTSLLSFSHNLRRDAKGHPLLSLQLTFPWTVHSITGHGNPEGKTAKTFLRKGFQEA